MSEELQAGMFQLSQPATRPAQLVHTLLSAAGLRAPRHSNPAEFAPFNDSGAELFFFIELLACKIFLWIALCTM